MSDIIKAQLAALRELSKIELQLNQHLAEKNRLNEQLTKKNTLLIDSQKKHDDLAADLLKKQTQAKTQEAYLREEQQKLVARRKSIQTLNDYKLQEKANKEIDSANKQLHTQEEKLLELMDVTEGVVKSKENYAASIVTLTGELASLQAELTEAFQHLDQKINQLRAEQEQTTKNLTPKELGLYRRIAGRYPGNAVVPLQGNSCTGCYFSLSPQILVKVAKGAELVTCQSCGRVLTPEIKAE